MYNVVVRRPRKEDIEKLNSFFALVIKDTFANNGIADLIDTIDNEIIYKGRILNEDYRSNGKNRYFLVATIDNKIVGTIEHGLANEEIEACTKGELSGVQEIGTLFVHPDFQGQGIGNVLLSNMFQALHDKKIEEFCFDSGYKSAQKIWIKKFGKPKYHLRNYWGEGADHMVWRLKTMDVLK